ncbi:MAG: hypothetical protein AAB434_11930 [Planctomycetota bacterium]
MDCGTFFSADSATGRTFGLGSVSQGIQLLQEGKKRLFAMSSDDLEAPVVLASTEFGFWSFEGSQRIVQPPHEFVRLRDVDTGLSAWTVEALLGPPLLALVQFFEEVRDGGGAGIGCRSRECNPSLRCHTPILNLALDPIVPALSSGSPLGSLDFDSARAQSDAMMHAAIDAEVRVQERVYSLIGMTPPMGLWREILALVLPGALERQSKRVFDRLASEELSQGGDIPVESATPEQMTRILSEVWLTRGVNSTLKRIVCHDLLRHCLKQPSESPSEDSWKEFLQREGPRFAEWRRLFVDGSGPATGS